MDRDYEPGDKIEFMLPDKNANPKWFPGVIHGVKRYEEGGIIKRQTYLVDTGRDTRVDEYGYDVRHREIDRRVVAEQAKGGTPEQVIAKVVGMADLPKSKIVIEKVRQPEQIELPYESLRLPQA